MAQEKFEIRRGFQDDDRVLNVSVPAEVNFNLEKMQKVTANLLNRLGCPNCHSGFDIRFRLEREFMVNAKTLEIEAQPTPFIISRNAAYDKLQG